jgi:feruloyl esterase
LSRLKGIGCVTAVLCLALASTVAESRTDPAAQPTRAVAASPADQQNVPRRAIVPPVINCDALTRPAPDGTPPPDFTTVPEAPTTLISSFVVPAAATTPEYCDVKGYISPQVHFQLKLPTATYQGRYLQQGCGGYCGAIPAMTFPACDVALGGDFAMAATNDGHSGPGGAWALHDQQLRIDYGYRAVHVLSIAAKAIITRFYGTAPRYSYFNGCSDGGREGMLEAERYPADFDGIVAGALEIYAMPLNAELQTWNARVNTDARRRPSLTPDRIPALHDAVLAACDGLDGLVDGQIDDPRACTFDPASIQCPPGVDRPDCLSVAQVEAARKLYSGPVDETGQRLYPSGLTYGSESAWPGFVIAAPGARQGLVWSLSDAMLRFQIRPVGEMGPTPEQWQFTSAEFDSLREQGSLQNATQANLSAPFVIAAANCSCITAGPTRRSHPSARWPTTRPSRTAWAACRACSSSRVCTWCRACSTAAAGTARTTST